MGAARGMRFAGDASRGELGQVARRCLLHGVVVQTLVPVLYRYSTILYRRVPKLRMCSLLSFGLAVHSKVLEIVHKGT